MKAKLWIVLMLIIPFILSAEVVDPATLKLVCEKIVSMENRFLKDRGIDKEFTVSRLEAVLYQGQEIGYIVHLYPEGFILSPAITELNPVKFITLQGKFSGIKNHPFFKETVNRISYTRKRLYPESDGSLPVNDSDPADPEQMRLNEAHWQKVRLSPVQSLQDGMTAEVTAVAPMLTSTWNQGTTTTSGNAYNMYCPTIDNRHCYTGCSATAQAQVMYYWKYPLTGQGSHSYTWNSQTLSASFNHQYYWDRMVDNYNGGQTAPQEDAVARLMSDVGISINMNYGLTGSGAVPNANNSLYSYFKYSSDVHYEDRSQYASWYAWFLMFKSQMDSGWPAILATFKPGSGHAVVIDGYRTSPSSQVHVNLGWGGYADGYYSMDDIYGYGDATSDYAVVDIYPPGGAATLEVTSPSSSSNWDKNTTHAIQWITTGSQDTRVKIRLFNPAGTVKVADITDDTANDGSYDWTVPASISPGSYIVRVKTLDNAVWDDGEIFAISEPASIEVTYPGSSDTLLKGNSYDITWDTTGSMDANVKIRLFNSTGTVKIADITESTHNDGSFNWTIPSDIPPGSYRVRIKTLDNQVYDDGDVFSISDSGDPTISVTSPGSGDSWAWGTVHTITWTQSGGMDANVKIRLFNSAGTMKIANITDSTPNDGSFTWTVPGTTPGGSYLVRVKTLDNQVYDDGDPFNITEVPTITVTSPGSGDAWQRGTTRTITWTAAGGTMDSNVKIRLFNSTGTVKIVNITDNTANDGSFDWAIPVDILAGTYLVRVKTLDNQVYDDGDPFTVVE